MGGKTEKTSKHIIMCDKMNDEIGYNNSEWTYVYRIRKYGGIEGDGNLPQNCCWNHGKRVHCGDRLI